MAASRLARLIATAAAVLTAAGGCVVTYSTGGGPAGDDPGAGAGLGRTAAPVVTGPANDVVQRSLKDVERYWTATFPTLADGARFVAVRGGYHPYTETHPPPACGDQRGEYQPNAFYCPAGDFIAWDAQRLIPQLYSDFGPLLVGVVMAHEYGHAIQQDLHRTSEPTVVLEQQADCFAGAWVGDVMAGHSTAFGTVTPKQLDSTVAGLLMLRDQPGTPARAPQAHGNAFDRIRAFQEGVQQHAARCATYSADTVPVTEVPFSSRAEAATGGDLPYDQAVADLSADAERYWERTFPQLARQSWTPLRVVPFDPADPPACQARDAPAGASAFYCPDGSYVAFDTVQLGPALYQRIGDNAVGMLIGDLFARAAQERRGRSATDSAGQVVVDCLAGSWTHDLLTGAGNGGIRLSPGDLDEAVAALLVFGRSAGTGQASAFDRISGYREGVLKGLPACG